MSSVEFMKTIMTRYLNLVFMTLRRINEVTPERKLICDNSSLMGEKRSDSSDHLDFDLAHAFNGLDGIFHFL
jgi:hypothetical protein